MAASQQRHVIALKSAHRPFILSGYETLPALLSSSAFAIKAKKEGVVKKVTDKFIVIQYKDGTQEVYLLEPTGSGTVKVALEYDVLVEEGQQVKPNQLLAKNKFFFDENGIYTSGIRFYTVFMPYRGFNYEDGLILSESAAKKLGVSVHIDQKDIIVTQQETIVSIITELGHITSKKPLLVTKPKHQLLDVEEYEINPDVLSFSGYKFYPLKYDADILSIEVYAPSEEFVKENFPKLLPIIQRQIEEANETIAEYKKLGLEPDLRTKLKANPYGVSYKGDKLKDYIVIRYIYRYEKPTELGDKFANLHGNKGVVSRIIPDDLMPRDPNGKPFDMIANQLGIVSRKNPGQLLEMYLSRACQYITDKLKEDVTKASYDTAINTLKEFYEVVYERFPRIKDQLIRQLNSMSDEDKKKVIDDFIDKGVIVYSPPVNGLNLNDVLRIYQHYGWKFKDYVTLPEFGNVKSKYPCAYGYVYWLKLEQMVDTKMSARSYGKRYKSKTMQPVGDKGEKAQREGELDTWSLLSWGSKNILKEFMTIHSDDIKAKFDAVNRIMHQGKVSMEDLEFTKPISNRMLKAYIAGMMITDDLEV
jgi:DNA-directed RNA polymerase subunit beta